MIDALLENKKKELPPLSKRSRHAWVKFAEQKASLDVIADLTLKQAIPSSYSNNIKHRIDEDIASQNVAEFLDRLNYKVYKKSYKRYDKKLNVITAIEGGKGLLRDNRPDRDLDKRFHTHILLEQPSHLEFILFKKIILNAWLDTKWGYYH